jgi:hypothetical protein
MTDDEPVHLVEDETGDRFLVYGTDKGLRLDIRYEGETLWMTQAQIAQLFGVDRSVVTKHLANVYAEGELEPEATSAKIAQVRQEGSRKVERQIDHYNLDAVISVGYRVSSAQATVFRRWATGGKRRPGRRTPRDHSRHSLRRSQCLSRASPDLRPVPGL